MYDINVKNVKKGKGFFYIFFFVGLLFLVIMGAILISQITYKSSLDASTVSYEMDVTSHEDSEGTTMYSPKYYYSVNNEEYICSSSTSSSTYPSNKNVIIYYSSKNPSKCMSEYDSKGFGILALFLIIPIIFIAVAVYNFHKINQKVKKIMQLNTYGRLVKNLPYRMEDSNVSVNNRPLKQIVVDYVLPNGVSTTLVGDVRYDHKMMDADGMVDLVIDEANPENYFIDFEINRLTGNLPTDYSGYQSNVTYSQDGQTMTTEIYNIQQ